MKGTSRSWNCMLTGMNEWIVYLKPACYKAAKCWKESSKFILFQQVFSVNLCGVTRAAVQLSYQLMSVGEFVNYVFMSLAGWVLGIFMSHVSSINRSSPIAVGSTVSSPRKSNLRLLERLLQQRDTNRPICHADSLLKWQKLFRSAI